MMPKPSKVVPIQSPPPPRPEQIVTVSIPLLSVVACPHPLELKEIPAALSQSSKFAVPPLTISNSFTVSDRITFLLLCLTTHTARLPRHAAFEGEDPPRRPEGLRAVGDDETRDGEL
jgi:hypothetical protein